MNSAVGCYYYYNLRAHLFFLICDKEGHYGMSWNAKTY